MPSGVRRHLASAWVLGLWLWSATAHGVATLSREGVLLRVANERIATTFNLRSGEWEVLTPDGRVIATRLRCGWGADPAQSSASGVPSYSFVRIHPPEGAGLQVEIERGRSEPFQLVLTVYDRAPCVLARIRAPRRDADAAETPFRFEGAVAPGMSWAHRHLVSFTATPQWERRPRDLGEAKPEDLWASDAFLFLEEPPPATTGILLAVTRNLARVRWDTRLESADGARALRFEARWSQSLVPEEKSPADGASWAMAVIAPLPPAQASACLRQLLRTGGTGEPLPADLAAVDAWDPLPAASAPAVEPKVTSPAQTPPVPAPSKPR